MLGAACFGLVFGLPFIIWGLLLIFDRERTWQKKLEKSKSNTPPIRSGGWDKRQILYGAILISFGIAVTLFLAISNYAALTISPNV